MQTIELNKPLKINGKDVTSLDCDMDAVTVDGFAEAEKRAADKRGAAVTVAESDYLLHMYLGFEGIIATDQRIDVSDLERLKGRDLARVIQAGRFFFIGSDEDSADESSEAASASTATSTAAAPTK